MKWIKRKKYWVAVELITDWKQFRFGWFLDKYYDSKDINIDFMFWELALTIRRDIKTLKRFDKKYGE